MSLVRCAAQDSVLPPDASVTEEPGALLNTDQTDDRGTSVIRIPNRGTSSEVQQEHRTAEFPADAWQARPVGFRPRVRALPSIAPEPNERWATDLCRIWSGRNGWAILALVMDCRSRELLGWHLSRSGRFKTAESDLGQALIARLGTLGRVPKPAEAFALSA